MTGLSEAILLPIIILVLLIVVMGIALYKEKNAYCVHQIGEIIVIEYIILLPKPLLKFNGTISQLIIILTRQILLLIHLLKIAKSDGSISKLIILLFL